LRTPLDANVVQTDEAKTIIVTSTSNEHHEKVGILQNKGVSFVFVELKDTRLDLEQMLHELYKLGITDLLVEGGGQVNASFLRAGLIDKYFVYIAPKVLGGKNSITPFLGADLQSMDEAADLQFDHFKQIGQDLLLVAYPVKG
jgi:diaminohydroxyphosphoribosylaminopyrimidine deaminase/5-amino-6-(5-phosphoribosylamino)uracil reductase